MIKVKYQWFTSSALRTFVAEHYFVTKTPAYWIPALIVVPLLLLVAVGHDLLVEPVRYLYMRANLTRYIGYIRRNVLAVKNTTDPQNTNDWQRGIYFRAASKAYGRERKAS